MTIETYLLDEAGWRSLRRPDRVIVPPPPVVHFTHGRDVSSADYVGIAGRGLTIDDLTPVSGGVYNVDGAVIEGKVFSGECIINGDNIIVKDCLSIGSGENFIAFRINGSHILFDNTSVIPPEGESGYVAYLMNGGEDVTLRRVYATRYENLVTTVGHDGIIEDSRFEMPDDISNLSVGGGHKDVFEIYAGSVTIRRTWGVMGADETVVVNVAPWGADDVKVDYAVIEDSYLDGGISHILVDYQGVTEDVYNVRVRRNDMGGHTFPGYATYWALNNHATDDDENGPRPVVETLAEQEANPRAILWPTSGSDANHWVNAHDLDPDRTGQIVIP